MEEQKYGFHRGINPAYAHTSNGLYHFSFVKALTNLTDLGPDDGGTTVIPEPTKSPKKLTVEQLSTRPWPTLRSSTKSKHRLDRRCSFTNR